MIQNGLKKIFFLVVFLTGNNLYGQVSPWQMAQQTLLWSAASPASRALLERGWKQPHSQEFIFQVLQQAGQLKRRGLPVEPYLLKANEGLAKGVSPDKMAPALNATLQRTELANQWVNRAVSQGWVISSDAERQKAILNFHDALLNQVSPQRLEGLIGAKAQGGAPGKNLHDLGKQIRALSLRRNLSGEKIPQGEIQPPVFSYPKSRNAQHPPKDKEAKKEKKSVQAGNEKAAEKGSSENKNHKKNNNYNELDHKTFPEKGKGELRGSSPGQSRGKGK